MSNATLIAHVDCTYKTRDELKALYCPEPTKSWKPIPHYELVTTLEAELNRRGINIVSERYAVGGIGDAKLFGTMALAVPDFPDDLGFRTALGLRTANNKTRKVELVSAANVFVCDNLAFSGSQDAVCLAKKHTKGLDLAEAITPAIDMYLDRCGVWRADLERMHDYELTDGRAKEILYDGFMCKSPILPARMLDDVHRLYFGNEEQRSKFEDRSLWSLNNACTEAAKKLPPGSFNNYGMEIGRYFQEVLHAGQRAKANALPFQQARSTFAWNN